MPDWLYQLAYGLSRGFWDAYFDAMRDGTTATEEVATDADRARGNRFRLAVQRVQPVAAAHGDTGSDRPAPDSGAGNAGPVGPARGP